VDRQSLIGLIPSCARSGFFVGAAMLFVLRGAIVIAAEASSSTPPAGGDYGSEIVRLPPYELDAVEPPWARDTRTVVSATVLL
jgi:hypothetical protein